MLTLEDFKKELVKELREDFMLTNVSGNKKEKKRMVLEKDKVFVFANYKLFNEQNELTYCSNENEFYSFNELYGLLYIKGCKSVPLNKRLTIFLNNF